MKNKKKIAIGAVALSAVLIAVGTFAWFSTTDKVPNIFDMDNFDVVITEAFDPSDVPLVPGADITKEVSVSNNGNMDVLVRVKLEETLSLLMQDKTEGVDKVQVEYLTDTSNNAKYVPVAISEEMIQSYEDQDYTEYTTTSYNNLAGITVLQKATQNNGENANANTVYSYLAYKKVEKTATTPAYNHLVRLTPVIGTGTAENPQSFTVEYAYNVRKDAGSTTYSVTATHGLDDNKLDSYYNNGSFHDVIILNFDTPGVQTDGKELTEDTNWYLASDGYFYYTKVLEGSTITEPLLKSVSISEDAGNALRGATYTISPIMEAVQVEHEAVTATWIESYDYGKDTSPATVSNNDADGINQLIANIINTKKGYVSA